MPVVLTTLPNGARQQVQVDFAHDPTSASFTWTDLTNRTRSANYRRGRSYERDRVEAGTGGAKLRNDDGALDPTNGSSPYWPHVMPYRRYQHNVTYAGVTYPIFTGLVERWPQEWDTGYGYAPVQVVDLFAWLAQSKLRTAYEHEVLLDRPAAFWPLSDPSGSTSASNIGVIFTQPGTIVSSKYGAGTLAFGTSTTLADASTAITVSSPDNNTTTGTARATYINAIAQLPFVSGFAFEIWFRTAATSPLTNPESVLACIPVPGTAYGAVFVKTRAGTAGYTISVNGTGGFGVNPTSSTPVVDGKWHHLAVVLESDLQTCHAYLDGVLDATSVSGFGPLGYPALPSSSAFTLGVEAGNAGSGTFVDEPFNGDLRDFAVYIAPLTAARVQAHYLAGKTAFAGDTADARISRILSYIGWSPATDVDVCTTTLLGADIVGKSVLDAVQEVATSEGGVFFVSKAGVLTYRSRRTRMQTTTSAVTFGEGAGETPYLDIAFDFDPTYIYNDIQVTRSGASPMLATDSTSQGHYGLRSLAADIGTQSDTEARDEADWLLNFYANPHARVRSVTVDAFATPGAWAAVLGLDVGSRVTVKRRPPGGPVITINAFVESLAWDIVDVRSAKCTLTLSPISLQALIADDPVYGVCNSTFVAAW